MSAGSSASIRQRLLNLAKAQGRLFDEILKRYAVERFLYRLSMSEYASSFILKGAQLLRVWSSSAFRPTQDLDLLGYTENSTENLTRIVMAICNFAQLDDGLRFDPDSVIAEYIKEDALYQGVRVTFVATLGSARIPLQLDVGFNDIVTPRPQSVEFPVLLDHPAPKLQGYTPQTVIAEKLEAMVMLGERNSRMKDFYDLLHLSRSHAFEFPALQDAVIRTFDRRGTSLTTTLPVLLQAEHQAIDQKQVQWSAFRKRSRLLDAPESFIEVVKAIRSFVEPVFGGAVEVDQWSPTEGWR